MFILFYNIVVCSFSTHSYNNKMCRMKRKQKKHINSLCFWFKSYQDLFSHRSKFNYREKMNHSRRLRHHVFSVFFLYFLWKQHFQFKSEINMNVWQCEASFFFWLYISLVSCCYHTEWIEKQQEEEEEKSIKKRTRIPCVQRGFFFLYTFFIFKSFKEVEHFRNISLYLTWMFNKISSSF